MVAVALTIAGSDPSGGAGIQADLKTFHRMGVYGASVLTLLTVQNTLRVDEIDVLTPGFVTAQLDSLLEDFSPGAAKTGALGDAAIIEAVARRAAGFDFPLVVDPVMISKHGTMLLPAAAIESLRERLLPLAFLVTPNLHEAAVLAGFEVNRMADMERAAEAILRLGPRHVLVKGGRLEGEAVDFLLGRDGATGRFAARHVDTFQTHGSGCAFSAAITALLARGEPVERAIRQAKRFITDAIRTAPGLGGGAGPVNLLA